MYSGIEYVSNLQVDKGKDDNKYGTWNMTIPFVHGLIEQLVRLSAIAATVKLNARR